jgi:hypothetical protein
MLDGEITWYKASLLTMVYSFLLIAGTIAAARLSEQLSSVIALMTGSCLATIFASVVRPKAEIKLWFMLIAVSVIVTISFFVILSASDI